MANVTIDVGAKLDGRSLDRVELQIERQIRSMAHDQGVNFGRDFADGWASQSTRIERATDRSKSALDRLTKAELDLVRAQKSGDIEQVIRANERLAKVRNDLASQNDRLERSNRNLFESMTNGRSDPAERQVRGLANSFANLGQEMAGVGKAAGPAGMAAIVPALGIAAGAAAQASGAFGLLPGVLGSAAAGFGTLKLATKGFSDALDAMDDPKKFAEALNELSPAAREAAIQIKALVDGPLDSLQKATQDALFRGIGPGLNSLATTLTPQLSTMTTGIASALNQALTGVMGQLQTPQNMASIGEIVNNIVAAFQNLAPAAKPFTDAMVQLTQVGTSFLPQLATSISQGAQAFSQFISEASRSGQLQDWIQGGIDAMKQLAPIAKDALAAFVSMRPIGETVLPLIRDTVHGIAVGLEAISPVVAKISPLFLMWKASVLEVKGAFDVIGSAIDFVANKINRLLDPLRAVAAVSNELLGTHISIPQLGTIAGTPVAAPGQPGAPGGALGSNAAADAWLRADQAAHPNSPNGLPSGAYRRRDGSIGYAAPPSAQDSIPSPLAGPYAPGGGGGGTTDQGPVVPRPSTDPISLLQPGQQITASLYQSAQSLIEAQWKVAQDQAILDDLKKRNNVSQQDLQKAENDLVKDKQDAILAQQRLVEAQQSATDSQLKASKTASDAFGKISAGLDNDLGISRGLPGLADNLVRFIGAIATAPLQAALTQITGGKDASETGSGLIGMFAGANGYGQNVSQYAPYMQYAPGGYPGDAALLSSFPKGTYDASGDLAKGLGDCSSAVEDLVNILDGRPTGGRQMSTGNAAEWLQEHGFLPGEGGPGDFRVGYNSSHMQATLPGGTPFNWGSKDAAARGGVGGTGAYDPSFTEHYYRPTSMSGSAPWSPSYGGGGGAVNLTPSAAPTAPPAYAPLAPDQLTDPGLTTPAPTSGGGMGTGNVAPFGPVPQSIPGLSSGQITNPGSDPNGWQPQGGSVGAGLGGLAMSGISSAISAAGMAGDAAGGGGGGSAAAAAAQLAMQAINRTIKFGGQATGDALSGLFETFGVGGSSLADPMQGWLGRAIGGLIGAAPQIPTKAGDGQQQQLQQPKDAQGQPGQQQGQDGKQGKNGGITIMGDWVNNVPNATAQQLANNLNFASAGGNSRSGG